MEWIEIIRLLGAAQDVQALQAGIRTQLNGLQNTPGLEKVLVMLHAMYATDFAIVLVWKNDREPVKTREGLLLADCLHKFGPVDHGVWTVLSDLQGSIVDKGNAKELRKTATEGRS